MDEIKIKVDQAKQLLDIVKQDLENLDTNIIDDINYLKDEMEDGTKRITITINLEE